MGKKHVQQETHMNHTFLYRHLVSKQEGLETNAPSHLRSLVFSKKKNIFFFHLFFVGEFPARKEIGKH